MISTTLRTVPTVLLLLLLLAGAGCKEEESLWNEITPGLAYVDSSLGQGDTVEPGDFVVAHYTGWVWDTATETKAETPTGPRPTDTTGTPTERIASAIR